MPPRTRTHTRTRTRTRRIAAPLTSRRADGRTPRRTARRPGPRRGQRRQGHRRPGRLATDGQRAAVPGQGTDLGPERRRRRQVHAGPAVHGRQHDPHLGTDASSKPLFDSAAAHGIKVVAGFWLQPGGGPGSGGCVNYLTDTAYKNQVLTEFPQWVQTYKDNPGVLMWDVGNESVLGLQNCYSGDELERQRDAYTTLVNDITKKIHAVDPNHPVTSTDAWVGAWPYFKKNAPDLDLYAVTPTTRCATSSPPGSKGLHQALHRHRDRPGRRVGGPERRQRRSAGTLRPGQGRRLHPRLELRHRAQGVALGATMFHYGTEYDFGGIWFNLLPAGQKRLSYYAVKRAYGGDTSHDNTPPVISDLTVEGGAGQVQAGRDLVLSVRATDPDGDPISYEVLDNSNYVDQSKNLVSLPSTNLGGGRLKVTAPDRPGVWKVYVKATDGRGNVGVETRSIRVVPPVPSGTNVARADPPPPRPTRRVTATAPAPRPTRWTATRPRAGPVTGATPVGPGRSRHPHHVPARPVVLGGLVRQGLHDPDLRRRPELADRAHRFRRQRRDRRLRRHRDRPLRPRQRHGAGHGLWVFAVRVRRLRLTDEPLPERPDRSGRALYALRRTSVRVPA